jgi:DNA-binding response OmpR family regulator
MGGDRAGFPPFRLDTVNQCLCRRMDTGSDERILLTPKAFAVLRLLVERAGRLVTNDELLDAVWPDTHVEPAVLNNQILRDCHKINGTFKRCVEGWCSSILHETGRAPIGSSQPVYRRS